ncbi:hypothetical protein TrRE_jg10472 [Triparma retinervis]|uniref:Transmembrane protein n=1 Tax=Triparma retinervis TaxID=2557542 RepID=A0A9W7DZU0_9STRA|nr:hypothetical protein TrRE_jg10472 [Triparma retinervis]
MDTPRRSRRVAANSSVKSDSTLRSRSAKARSRSTSKGPKPKTPKSRQTSSRKKDKDEDKDAGSERFSTKGDKANSFFKPPPTSEIISKLFSFDSWLLYPDSKGSLGGFFDFVPLHLRVGPWFILAPIFIVTHTYVLFSNMPNGSWPTFTPSFPEPFSLFFYLDCFFFVNNACVLYVLLSKAGPAVLCTFTVWSWCILTFRCLSSAVCSLYPGIPLLPYLSEFFRFPALVAATLTTIVWNFVLAPIMYFAFFKTAERRKQFLLWNLQFTLQEIHTFNLPIAVTNAVLSTGGRMLQADDLWSAFFVLFCYSMLYLFILDRLGVHLYPVFSPRSKFSVIAWSTVFCLYATTFIYWNQVMELGRMESVLGGLDILWQATWATQRAVKAAILG